LKRKKLKPTVAALLKETQGTNMKAVAFLDGLDLCQTYAHTLPNPPETWMNRSHSGSKNYMKFCRKTSQFSLDLSKLRKNQVFQSG
jgi:hypothetical protein